MPPNLDSVIQLGQDITAHKYYAICTGAILFYDYLLTLADEVKYAWSEKKAWVFWLFIVNRYFPMTWQLWQITVSYAPRSRVTTQICEKSSFYPLVMFVVCTLLAQTVLTVRIYAVTMKNISITTGLAAITATQCVLGICMTVLTARKGAQPQPPIPLDAYHLCVFSQIHRGTEVAYTSLSLFYDVLAFSLVVFWARGPGALGLGFSTFLDAFARDTTYYFMVIFTSHFVLVMTLNLGRVTIQLLPGAGVLVYLPLMVSRIILSLRKAADRSQVNVQETTNGDTFQSILTFFPWGNGSIREEEIAIPLDTFRQS